jgi:altronate dehydratase small subunit
MNDSKITAIKMHIKDNVATMIQEVDAGKGLSVISAGGSFVAHIKSNTAIPLGHKIAIERIGKDDDVVKYGETIGRAVRPIEKGEHVHIHNVESKRIQ